jgi:catechol 2,3-dioxygenase-like lactoylglutathione lyase family enzyme
MEVLGINVKDVRKATAFFSDLFEMEFGEFVFGADAKSKTSHADAADPSRLGSQGIKVAMDRRGFLELLETAKSEQDEGFRNIHFKVTDMRLAKQEMEQRGIHMLAEHRIGGVWEVVYNPAELYGIRLCLVEYDAPTLIDAVLQDEGGPA